MAEEEGKNAIGIMSGLVATVAGFTVTKDAFNLYFSGECTKCEGTGLLTCKKCRGFGFLRSARQSKVNAFSSGSEDIDNLQVCTFCTKNAGVFQCTACKGKRKQWLDRPNFEKLWRWHDPHWNALKRHNKKSFMETESVRTKETKKLLKQGQGGFSMSGSSNMLPYEAE